MPKVIPPCSQTKRTGHLVDLMEYQAKELFAKHGVATTLGVVVETPEAARAAAEEIGGVTVVKAQVKAGGRGKAGGVKIAKTADEADRARARHPRHGDQGPDASTASWSPRPPRRWRSTTSPSCSTAPTARTCASPRSRAAWRSRRSPRPTPTPSSRSASTPSRASTPEKAAAIVDEAKFPAELRDQAVEMVQALWKVFVEEDATLVEVNPLARLEGDKLEALDGKVSLDDNASEVRHPDHEQFEIREEADPLEAKAKDKGLNYVKLDGQVGIIGNGAGLSCAPSTSSPTPVRRTAA